MSQAPPKPWELAKAGRPPAASPVPSVVGGAAPAVAATTGPTATTAAAAATGTAQTTPSTASSYSPGSMYGGYGGGYGSSMYGGGYGGSMYGRSMYGGGMGGGMYGGSSMYGGGGMMGRQGGEAEFFAPKLPESQQPEEASAANRIVEIKELNTGFLDSLHGYGDRFLSFIRVLAKSFISLHAALRAGCKPPADARKAIITVAAVAVACIAMAARAAANRRRRLNVTRDQLFPPGQAVRWPARSAYAWQAQPRAEAVAYPVNAGWPPRASL